MSIIRWRPFGDLLSIHDGINQLFENEFFHDHEKGELSTTSWSPSTDIYENKNEYVFKIDLPGLSKESINIELNEKTLTVKGEKKEEKEVKRENLYRSERCNGTFFRSFNIPRNTDHKKINAKMKDGVLELRVPKIEESTTKSIPINIK